MVATTFLCSFGEKNRTKKAAESTLLLSVECPYQLSNFFEDFNKIVGFIEKHYVFNNKRYNINSRW